MDFTREPIVESIITPKEGCKLVIRSSKSASQEEHFVDAVEVVSFGYALFYRSLERPKAFLVPATDYEVLEVREARIVLKNVGVDRSIKIGGGREAGMAPTTRQNKEPNEKVAAEAAPVASEENGNGDDKRFEKKRDRRRQSRRRRGRDEIAREEEAISDDLLPPGQEVKVLIPPPNPSNHVTDEQASEAVATTTTIFSTLLPPPPTLIRETIAKYKDNVLFKDAFYTQEEREAFIESKSHPVEAVGAPKEGIQDLLDEEDDELHMPSNETRYRSAEPQEGEDDDQNSPNEPFLSSETPAEQVEFREFHIKEDSEDKEKEDEDKEEVTQPAHKEVDSVEKRDDS